MNQQMKRSPVSRLLLAVTCLLCTLTAGAGDMPGPDDKPFAEAHIVLQLSDGEEAGPGFHCCSRTAISRNGFRAWRPMECVSWPA
jgi:hypothetical protein